MTDPSLHQQNPSLANDLSWKIAAFYKFAPLENREALRADLMELAAELSICGTILLSPEGLNATLSGRGDSLEIMLAKIRGLEGFSDLKAKWSFRDKEPFFRFKAKLKKSIITMGDYLIEKDTPQGPHLKAEAWNELLDDPELVLIDTRNDYEVKVGTFENAIDPDLKTFGEFPKWVEDNLDPQRDKKVAMFCTGGIRCEKASAYMLEQGFENVFQLEGGILKYLETTAPKQNKWQGECFVFDSRVTVDKDLNEGSAELCYACRLPLLPEEKERPEFELGVTCHYCIDITSEEQKERFRERQKQQRLAAERDEKHLGKVLDLKGKRPAPAK